MCRTLSPVILYLDQNPKMCTWASGDNTRILMQYQVWAPSKKCLVSIHSSVQFSHSVTSDSSWPQGPQHTRPPCPSPTPGVYPNSSPLSPWWHSTISSSVDPFFSCFQSFSNESALHLRWPKYWSFSFNISPSNEHPGLISFTMDWLGLLAVQETLKNLLQHHSSKASIFQHSAFFIVQLSHPYMTTGKNDSLDETEFVGKVMSTF